MNYIEVQRYLFCINGFNVWILIACSHSALLTHCLKQSSFSSLLQARTRISSLSQPQTGPNNKAGWRGRGRPSGSPPGGGSGGEERRRRQGRGEEEEVGGRPRGGRAGPQLLWPRRRLGRRHRRRRRRPQHPQGGGHRLCAEAVARLLHGRAADVRGGGQVAHAPQQGVSIYIYVSADLRTGRWKNPPIRMVS